MATEPKQSRRQARKARKQAAANDPTKMSRRKQMLETYKMTKRTDPRLPLWMLGALVGFGAIGYGIFWLLPGSGAVSTVFSVIGALLFGTLGAMIVFSRRAQRSAYEQLEGQLGAGARALTMLRRGWKVEEMIGFTKQQDLLHRVVGPPGILLVGEGNPHRLRQLVNSERKKHERVAYDVPIHEIIVGREEGQVPLPKLVKHIRKLRPRALKPGEMTDVLARIKALDAQRPRIPLPHGPVPTSMRGMRQQMKGR